MGLMWTVRAAFASLILALGCNGGSSEAAAGPPTGEGQRCEKLSDCADGYTCFGRRCVEREQTTATTPSSHAADPTAAPNDAASHAEVEKIVNTLSLLEGVTKRELESSLGSAGFKLHETNRPQSVAMEESVLVNDFSTSFYEKEEGNIMAMVNFGWNDRGVDGVEITVQARGLHDVPRNVLHAAFSRLIEGLPAGLFAKGLKGRDFPRVLGKLSDGPLRQALKVVGGVEYLYTEVPRDISLTINSED